MWHNSARIFTNTQRHTHNEHQGSSRDHSLLAIGVKIYGSCYGLNQLERTKKSALTVHLSSSRFDFQQAANLVYYINFVSMVETFYLAFLQVCKFCSFC